MEIWGGQETSPPLRSCLRFQLKCKGHMDVMANCQFMQGTKFTDEDFLRGEGMIWFNWEEVYQLYHQDALDISIVSLVRGVL